MKKKSLSSALLIALIIGGLILVSTIRFGAVHASTNVTGVISTDTTWTQASSPYTLTGNVLVAEGVTLTIQPGTTVNFNGYYMRVNGTLSAIGTNNNKITLAIDNPSSSTAASAIEFKSSGSSWNDQTNSGSIIENAVINSKWGYGYGTILIDSVSPKIDNNIIDCTTTNGELGTAISNLMANAAPIISNNTIWGQVVTSGGILCNNAIYGKVGAPGGLVCNNTIRNPGGYGITISWKAIASGNTVSECDVGVALTIPPSSSYGVALLQGNLIYNNNYGVQMLIGSTEQPILSTIAVENNTIINNNVGVYFSLSSPMSTYRILNNNIFNNSNYNFQTSVRSDVNATQNWWGTTDTQAISQKIFDYKNDFNLGTVTFVPFLTEPNLQAMPSSNPPSLGPSPSPTPTPTPSPQSTPILEVSCKSSTSYSNFKVDITGTLTADGSGVSNVPILISYSVNGGTSWIDLTTVNTNDKGDFTAVWLPSATGNYRLKATWTGDSTHSAISTTINFAVTPFEQNVFSVTSNSTVSELSFDSASRELRFRVEGPEGTAGYVNVYVSKSFMNDVSGFKVYLDGNELAYSTESEGDSWLLSFTYSHSAHDVTINMGSASSGESQLGLILVCGIPVIAIALFFAIRKINKKKT